jgi:ribosomal protein S18 acetylase RimI-like enzyme
MNKPIQLKPATLNDVAAIAKLADTIWHAHYPSIIGLEQVKFMLEKMYHPNVLSHHISEGPQAFFIIQSDVESLGFIAIEPKEKDELYLQKLYVLPTNHRRGIGAGALNEAVKYYPKAKRIRLQVNRQNYTAINFYFKLGFSIERVADFDIGDGFFMNDFVMLKHLN